MPDKKVIARAIKCSRKLKSRLENPADGCKKLKEIFTFVAKQVSCLLMICVMEGPHHSPPQLSQISLLPTRAVGWGLGPREDKWSWWAGRKGSMLGRGHCSQHSGSCLCGRRWLHLAD